MLKPVICIGASIIDDSFYCLDKPVHGTSNLATHFRSVGGVARNVAHHLAQLGNHVELISHFGNDTDGTWLKERCLSTRIGLSHSRFSETGTGHFAAIVSPEGEFHIGVADTHLEDEITIPFLTEQRPFLETASLVLCDCNLSASCIAWLLDFCRTNVIPCVIEPVSVAKASRLNNVNLDNVLLITPNDAELAVLSGGTTNSSSQLSIEYLLAKGVKKIWIRKGKKGSELFSREETVTLPAPEVEVLDTTGAGDAALAGWIHAWLQHRSVRECLIYGQAMAKIILQAKGANAEQLNIDLLEETVANLRTSWPITNF